MVIDVVHDLLADMSINSSISEKLTLIKAKTGISDHKLAKELGVPQQSITQWRNGQNKCTNLRVAAQIFQAANTLEQ